ncbi:MAG: DUF1501 domain-containing protein [Pirellulaceae bacterium]
MNEHDLLSRQATRRHLFQNCGVGLGSLALGSLIDRESQGAESTAASIGALPKPHFPPHAKNVIFLFMAGGPSQLELFSDKPKLAELNGQTPPAEFMEGKRFSFLGKDAKLLGGTRKYAPAGECGYEISELLPYHRDIVDNVCFIQSMNTDVFNHGPAKIFVNSGSPQPGRPSMGSWITYGIGSECDNLPGFVVLQSGPRGPRGGAALWSSGFLPSRHQGVPFQKHG